MTERKCSATTAKGAPCRGKPLQDSDFCMAHQPKKEVEEVAESAPVCGHINRHSRGPDGKPDNLSCTLAPGHKGDHGAIHEEYRFYGEGMPRETEPKPNNWRFWLEIAGTPPEEIVPDRIPVKKVEVPESVWEPK